MNTEHMSRLEELLFSGDPEQKRQALELVAGLRAGAAAELDAWLKARAGELLGARLLKDKKNGVRLLSLLPEPRPAALLQPAVALIESRMKMSSNQELLEGVELMVGLRHAPQLRDWFAGAATGDTISSLGSRLSRRNTRHIVQIFNDILVHQPPAELAKIKRLRYARVLAARQQGVPFPSEAVCRALPNLEILDMERYGHLPSVMPPLPKLRVLILRRRSSSTLPPTFTSLTALEELDLSDSEFTALPDVVGQIPTLRKLILTNCRSLQTLPESLGALPKLEVLDVSRCRKLTALPESLGRAGLTVHTTGCTSLASVPAALRSQSGAAEQGTGDLATLRSTEGYSKAQHRALASRLRKLLRSKLWDEVLAAVDAIARLNDPVLDRALHKNQLTLLRGRLRRASEVSIKQGLELLRRLRGHTLLLQLWGNSLTTPEAAYSDELAALNDKQRSRVVWQLLGMLPAATAKTVVALPYGLVPRVLSDEDWQILSRLTGLQRLTLKGPAQRRWYSARPRDPTVFSEMLGALTGLRHLLIENHPDLIALPDALFSLSGLQSLTLRYCGVKALPETWSGLRSLKTLHIEECSSLTALPAGLGAVTTLEAVRVIACRQVRGGGQALVGLSGLTELTIRQAGIHPTTLVGLRSLERLELVQCGIGARPGDVLPPGLTALTALTTLTLGEMENIASLPPLPPRVTTLSLESLPALTALPEGTERLTTLKLNSCRRLRAIPSAVPLRGTSITLQWVGIERLPDDLTSLTELTALSLINCRNVQALPADFGRLVNLERLTLSGEMTELPPSITALTRLHTLNLGGCRALRSLPEGLLRGPGASLSVPDLLLPELLPDVRLRLATLNGLAVIDDVNRSRKIELRYGSAASIVNALLDSLGRGLSARRLPRDRLSVVELFPERGPMARELKLGAVAWKKGMTLDLTGCELLRYIKGSDWDLQNIGTIIARDCRSLDLEKLAQRCEAHDVTLVV